MIGYVSASFPGNILVIIMTLLNDAVYGLVSTISQVFMRLTEVTLFDDGLIGEFQQRIYVVLGIFMLFKFAFSLLTSIVNPDNLVDKEKGMGKIVSRTIVALILLVIVPDLFKYALDWQNKIALAVPKIIIGKSTRNDAISNSTMGDQLAATALKAFFQPNKDCDYAAEAYENQAREEEIMNIINEENTVVGAVNLAYETCEGQSKTYLFEFNGFVSLFAGIFMVVYLLGYCVDVAIRIIKIGILRLLAPIPIISYIDPKSEKNGAFGNWVKECGSTYIELFVKIGILYFILFILGNISGDSTMFNNVSGDFLTRAWIKLFLILGAFFFMGKAADFICNILGIKHEKGSGFLAKTMGFVSGAAIGAAGAVVTGGGLYGALSAGLEGAASGGAGGKITDIFNKGRDISVQMKTGDPGAKHKGLLTKSGDAIKRHRAEALGFTSETVEAAKTTMYKAKDEFANAAALRDRFNSGKLNDDDRTFMNQLKATEKFKGMSDQKMLDEYYNATNTNANKAEKYYSDAKAYAGVLGVQTSEPLAEKFAGGLNTQEYAPLSGRMPQSTASGVGPVNSSVSESTPLVNPNANSYRTNYRPNDSGSGLHSDTYRQLGDGRQLGSNRQRDSDDVPMLDIESENNRRLNK